jgi:poly(beta-D-mannuronate) lyase
VNCKNATELYQQLDRKEPVNIKLTGTEYVLTRPLFIVKDVVITGQTTKVITFPCYKMLAIFVLAGKGNLTLSDLNINGEKSTSQHFISNDTAKSAEHFNLTVKNCAISGFSKKNGLEDIFYAYKSLFADSVVFHNNTFSNNDVNIFMMSSENDNKGLYNAERIFIGHNKFENNSGKLLNVYRGGNDESTMGPHLVFSHNKITNCATADNSPLVQLTGVQVSKLFSNAFTMANVSNTLVSYKDLVRARHSFENNMVSQSGIVETNKYYTEKQNIFK